MEWAYFSSQILRRSLKSILVNCYTSYMSFEYIGLLIFWIITSQFTFNFFELDMCFLIHHSGLWIGCIMKQIFHSSSKNRSDMALHILLAVVEYLLNIYLKFHVCSCSTFWVIVIFTRCSLHFHIRVKMADNTV